MGKNKNKNLAWQEFDVIQTGFMNSYGFVMT